MISFQKIEQFGVRYRFILLTAYLIAWAFATSLEQKFRGLLMGTVFSGLEFVFTGAVDAFEKQHFSKHGMRAFAMGYTTIDMWLLNVIFSPLTNDVYYSLIDSYAVRWLLYPLNIWASEILMGYSLLLLFRRRAWHYTGRWARCHGTIKLSYVGVWWGMYILHDWAMHTIYVPGGAALAALVSRALLL